MTTPLVNISARTLRALAVTLLGGASLGAAATEGSYVAPMASYVIADDDRHTDDAFGGVLAFGRRFSSAFGAELRGSYLDYGDTDETGALCRTLNINIGCTSRSVSLTTAGLGLNYYVGGGGLYVHLDAMGGDHGQYHAGLGYDFGSFKRFALRAEALYLRSESFDEPRFNLGVRLPIGSKAAVRVAAAPIPTATPQPVRVVAPPPCELPPPGESLNLTNCKIDDRIVLEGLEFEIDSAEIRSDERDILDLLAKELRERREIKVAIHGHTDSTASDEYNQTLSERRADAVKTYLAEEGVAIDRISTRGFGESMPIADNDTDEGRARNRRVELVITERVPGPRSEGPAAMPTPNPGALAVDTPMAAPTPIDAATD
ncbi:MAG: OmpA family protein [Pseudomonadota bacterium]|nr:OmpA family protein [Pseudomonadota bacterium]